MKTYKELSKLKTFAERFRYLKLSGGMFNETFGTQRSANQIFYRSYEWKRLRDYIIIRDNGLDLGAEGCPISGKIIIHHLNPITLEDIENRAECLFDPDNLISTCIRTHNAIHYGDESILNEVFIPRTKYDTCPWKSNLTSYSAFADS